jgi:hypothetical protein
MAFIYNATKQTVDMSGSVNFDSAFVIQTSESEEDEYITATSESGIYYKPRPFEYMNDTFVSRNATEDNTACLLETFLERSPDGKYGTLKFNWSVESETDYDFFICSVTDASVDPTYDVDNQGNSLSWNSINGIVEPTDVEVDLSAFANYPRLRIHFVYFKDYSVSFGADTAALHSLRHDTLSIATIFSSICFTGDAIVQTDQGFVNFERINNTYTMGGKAIEVVTKTKTHDKYLICIDAGALGNGVPFQTTLVSRNHKISYNGRMICAKNLTDVEGIHQTTYSGQLLYNVVLEGGGNMTVNGMTVETLDKTNEVAKIYALPPKEFAEAVAKRNVKKLIELQNIK